MEKDQIILLEDRGLISISGSDAKDFLQNIITNDVRKVSLDNAILIQSKDDYLLDCDSKFTSELISCLSKYKLRSKIEIKDISSEYAIGILSLEKFIEIQKNEGESKNLIEYRESALFIDPRKKSLGARLLSTLEKLHLTVKKLNLKIIKPDAYFSKAHLMGIPIKGGEKLKDQLFSLEANFEDLQAIDFKKGCYIGQENTARMKLKNKLRKKLFAIKTKTNVKIGDELKFENKVIGKILIDKPFPFALINLYNDDGNNFLENEFFIKEKKVTIIKII